MEDYTTKTLELLNKINTLEIDNVSLIVCETRKYKYNIESECYVVAKADDFKRLYTKLNNYYSWFINAKTKQLKKRNKNV